MPIKIPNALPARETLENENIFVMTEFRAMSQDIRPLHILVLNLMPTKIATETQLARVLGNTPLQVELELLQVSSHEAKNVSQEHMLTFYKTFPEVFDNRYDGMVITGAPVEHLSFEQVDYWEELCQIMEWSKSHVHSTFHICWGAQAGLYYHYGIQKHPLKNKLFGVFHHIVERKQSILFRGFDDVFMAPHSRHTTVRREDIEANPELKILASSDRPASMPCRPSAGGRCSYSATPNTTRTRWKRSCSACSRTAWSAEAAYCSGALTTCSWCPIPATPRYCAKRSRRCRS